VSLIITGAYGFIASRLVQTLLKNGRKDLILVDSPEYRSTRNCVKGLEDLPLINRENFLEDLAKLKAVSAILHLGACTDTGNHDEDYMWRMNTDYTKRIWTWCSENKIPLLYASSGATYGKGEEGYSDDHRETARYQPLNVYGRSKHEFDLWALGQKTAPPHWWGLKFFNVYGPDESHKGRMASPVFHGFNEIQKTGRMSLFKSHKDGVADGEQKRDFIFVDDIVKLCLFCLEKNPPSGLYNCGTGQARTFLDLSKALFKSMGRESKINWIETPEKFRAAYQYFTQAEMGKIRAAGYSEPFLSIEEGVQKYVEWLDQKK